MKDQYFGDIGDYGKYSLLRAFADNGIRVGVNWYLTQNDGSADGKHIRYLQNPAEARRDPELFQCLKRLVDDDVRDVTAFEKEDMIRGASYYHRILDISDVSGISAKREKRERWHAEAMTELKEAELVFLDPDNGLRENNTTRKDSVKYAFASEVEDYYGRGQNVVYYCHKGRRTDRQWNEAKHILHSRIPDACFAAITFHRGTQRTFIFVIHREDYDRYDRILQDFLHSEWKEDFESEFINVYSGMKLSVIYDSKTGNTKQAAEWIAEGMNAVANAEARAFSIHSADEEFIRESSGIVIGSPSYCALMTADMHTWLFEKAIHLGMAGKLGGAFATEQYTHGGGEMVIQSILTNELVYGMLCYSSGGGCGNPFIHLGPVGVNGNIEEHNCLENYRDYFVIYGRRFAEKVMELFG